MVLMHNLEALLSLMISLKAHFVLDSSVVLIAAFLILTAFMSDLISCAVPRGMTSGNISFMLKL